MRALRPLLAFLPAAVILFGCGKADLSTGEAKLGANLRIVVPPLPDGERSTYRIAIAGTEVGLREQATRHARHCDVTPAFVFTIVEQTRTGNVPRRDSAEVWVTRDSLKPIASFHFTGVGQALSTTAALYRPGAVMVSTFVPQLGERQRPLPAGPATYDIDQLTALGRGIQIPAGRPADIAVLQPFAGAILPARVSPLPDERVTVPAGTFDCYRLRFEIGTSHIDVWYEKAGSRRMIRFESSDNQTLELLPGS